MRYLARISYDGSHYYGFQRLNDMDTIQSRLESVLSKINAGFVHVYGAGRTDRFVHALDQCVHFDLSVMMDGALLMYKMNRLLPSDISVNSIVLVDDDFHARHMVLEKRYLYKVYMGPKDPFVCSYSYVMYDDIDVGLIKDAAKVFVGHHDFRNFVSGYRDCYEAVINDIKVYKDGNYLCFEFLGKSFYRYMVRKIVGALLDVGRGKACLDDVLSSLNLASCKTFFCAPAWGLYLMEIKY